MSLPAIACNVNEVCATTLRFSVCTLVTDQAQYDRMIRSFEANGFNLSNTQFFYVDNRQGNQFDAYAGLNFMIARCSSLYVICCHQDIELLEDGFETLSARLEELNAIDPHWGVVGNAGGCRDLSVVASIMDMYGNQRRGKFPVRVESVDENFILIRRDALLGFSRDLQGFHFYGADICLQARVRGYSSYVIDFFLRHHGRGGRGPDFRMCKRNLCDKYKKAFRETTLRTTCTKVYIKGAESDLDVAGSFGSPSCEEVEGLG